MNSSPLCPAGELLKQRLAEIFTPTELNLLALHLPHILEKLAKCAITGAPFLFIINKPLSRANEEKRRVFTLHIAT